MRKETFDTVADVIARVTDAKREDITPESNVINDLGIDSLDFLDVVFELDREFGINIPSDVWIKEINDGKATNEDYFLLQNFCDKIDLLRKEKAGS